jgi:hypothetical protein
LFCFFCFFFPLVEFNFASVACAFGVTSRHHC